MPPPLGTGHVAAPTTPSAIADPDPRRWAVLGVLCLSAFITVLDGTIVNVTLPSLIRDLGATTRDLQWIVDAYLLVFTGLLLAGGGLGDRFGRRRVLVIGLLVFGVTSAYAGSASTTGELIAGRALMGIGAALIFPATLALITATFTDARERAVAIGVWSATSGVAVAAGPITGGWLLEHFWWGSVFFVNLPVIAVAVVAVVAMVPESRDESAPRLDVVGVLLSISAIGALVLTIIEAPSWGWTDTRTLVGFAATTVLLGAFVRWELSLEHPMLPVRIFRNLRFSAASVAITSAFFALFGFIFLITQYFQLVRAYTPLEAGVRTLPVAVSIALAAVLAPHLVVRLGTTRVVAGGLGLMSLGFVWVSTASTVTPYSEIVGQMILLGVGLGLTTAPATESIMGSLDADRVGVGSAVNDTTRELGGTLGVAVIGSVFTSAYVGTLADAPVTGSLPKPLRLAAEDSVGAAQLIAAELGAAAPAFLAEVGDAFLAGLAVGCLVAAGVVAAGAVTVLRYLPARAAPGPGEPARGDRAA